MVLPYEEGPQPPRVRIVRDKAGKIVGYQDPDAGSRFISRADAVKRLKVSVETGNITDTFGNQAGPGSVHIPAGGITHIMRDRTVVYQGLDVPPGRFTPGPNQELVESTYFITKSGKVERVDISYGLGNDYNKNLYHGKWRAGASEALGLDPNVRLPSADLKRAVLTKQYVVKTIK